MSSPKPPVSFDDRPMIVGRLAAGTCSRMPSKDALPRLRDRPQPAGEADYPGKSYPTGHTGQSVPTDGERMRGPLIIAVAQPHCVSYDVAVNAATHATTVFSARARVVVFPELSLTGYELDAPAIRVDDRRLRPIVEACAKTGSLALVGAPVHDAAGRSHIAMLAIDGTGAAVVYAKMWLSTTESSRFTAGIKPAVLDVDGWRLGLAICKDTGVRRHAADTAALGMDVYVAGTMKAAKEAAIQAERARRVAAEHHVWVAVASFAGSSGGYAQAAGRSAIWTPDGIAVAQAGPEIGAIAHTTLRWNAEVPGQEW